MTKWGRRVLRTLYLCEINDAEIYEHRTRLELEQLEKKGLAECIKLYGGALTVWRTTAAGNEEALK
jgi:hypothetical protein